MRGASIVIAFVVSMAGVASAEPLLAPPGMTPPLERDEPVSEIQQIVGPPTAAFIGFGLGHVIEGRWHERGWIFTAGETLMLVPFVYASANIECERNCALVGPAMITGMLGIAGLRIWEVVDSVTGARAKNRRIMEQRSHLMAIPTVMPVHGGGAIAGLALTF